MARVNTCPCRDCSAKRKACIGCGETKPLSAFYQHAMMGDGHLNKCKGCVRAYQRKRHREKIESDPEWRERERRRSREKFQRRGHSWANGGSGKRDAHHAVSNAVRDGRLTPANECEDCGPRLLRVPPRGPPPRLRRAPSSGLALLSLPRQAPSPGRVGGRMSLEPKTFKEYLARKKRQDKRRRESARRYRDRVRDEVLSGEREWSSLSPVNRERKRREFRRAYGSEERVKWMKRQGCIICGATPSECAHIEGGGMSRKADAEKTVPLCHSHHRTAPDSYHKLGGKEAFEKAHGISLDHYAAYYAGLWAKHTEES